MENEPNTENVVYMDEYPELKKRVWLRRLAQQRAIGNVAMFDSYRDKILIFPVERTESDGQLL